MASWVAKQPIGHVKISGKEPMHMGLYYEIKEFYYAYFFKITIV